jgi:hypothetical protein
MTFVVVLALSAFLAQHQPQGKESVRIYVFAAEPVDASPDDHRLEGRRAAVRDLRDALRHKAGLTIVDDRAHADVLVEVTDQEQDSLGEGGFGGARITPLVNTTIRLRVTAGPHDSEMKGTGPGTGSRAAKDAADKLLRWIVRNRIDALPDRK